MSFQLEEKDESCSVRKLDTWSRHPRFQRALRGVALRYRWPRYGNDVPCFEGPRPKHPITGQSSWRSPTVCTLAVSFASMAQFNWICGTCPGNARQSGCEMTEQPINRNIVSPADRQIRETKESRFCCCLCLGLPVVRGSHPVARCKHTSAPPRIHRRSSAELNRSCSKHFNSAISPASGISSRLSADRSKPLVDQEQGEKLSRMPFWLHRRSQHFATRLVVSVRNVT